MMNIVDARAPKRVPWTRYCYLPTADEQGLRRPDAEGDGLPFGDLREVPAVVLMAERGSGKTDVLAEEARALAEAGLTASLLDLGDLAEEPDLAGALSQKAMPPPDGGAWYVLLDSYDEALSKTPRPYLHLAKWWSALSEPAHAGLRLRIATRPGLTAAGAPLRKVLVETWGADGVQFRELARLDAEAIDTAARHFGLDPVTFAQESTRRGLQALVSLPVTLLEVLRDAAEGRDLPATATEAYARSCDRWCHETNEDREPPKTSDVKALLAAAEQAAAALHLCTAHSVLTDGAAAGEGLRVSDLADGPGTDTRVTEADLRELMSTGLMSWIDHQRAKFALRSVQEFLASEYLRHHEVPSATLQALLIAGQGPARHAVTAVRDLASWVAAWDDTVFDDLLAHDPYVLLGSDLAARPAPDTDRARLVEALLYRVSTERHGNLAPSGSLLYRLDHPGLAAQLTPYLAVPSADHEYQRLGAALLIAQAADPGHRPVDALLDLAEAGTLREGWRATALRCLPPEITAEQRARARGLASGQPEQIVTAAVEALWPHDRDLTELVDLAAEFPAKRLPVLLEIGRVDPRDVLTWAREQLAEPTDSGVLTSPTGAARRVARAAHALAWALDQATEPAALAQPDSLLEAALADTLADLAARADLWDHADTIGFPERLREPVEDAGLRRRLAEQLLGRVDSTDLLHLLDGPLDFFPPQDRIHWAEYFTDAPDPAKGFLTTVLSRDIGRTLTPEETAHLQQLTDADPQLGQAIESWSDTEQADKLAAAQALRDEQQRAQWRFDPAQLAAHLPRRPTGDDLRTWWWQITLLVGFRTPTGEPPRPASFHDVLDLTATPGWDAATDQHADLAEAAVWALENAPAITPGDAGKIVGYTITDVPELRALTVIAEPPALSTQQWVGIAMALLCVQVEPTDETTRRALLTDALKRAGADFAAALPDYLEHLPAADVEQAVTRLAETDPAHLAPVTAWAAADDRTPAQRRPVLRPLAAAGIANAVDLAHTDAAAAPPGGTQETDATWAQTVNIVLEHAPDGQRERTWDQILTDPALTDAWATGTDSSAAMASMTPTQLGTLYDRLTAAGHITPSNPLNARVGIGHPGIPIGVAFAAIPDTLAGGAPTQESLTALERLAATHPEHPRLPGLLHWHVLAMAETTWERPIWSTLHALATDADRHIIHDSSQLARIVLDALATVQRQLTGPNGLAPLLWNRTWYRTSEKKTTGQAPPWRWWPMWEEDLSDLVLHLLQLRLADHRLVINREVQIDRFGRTDIQIEAHHRWDATIPKVTVIIEAKGCWNAGVGSAARDQLVERYLTRDRGAAGIYLVGYFDSPTFWVGNLKPGEDGQPAEDRKHTAHTFDELTDEQHELAAALRAETGAEVHAFVLDCRPDPVEAGVVTGHADGI